MNIIREQPGRAGEVGMSFDFLHPSPNSINISEEATALADEMPAIVQDVEEIELIDQNEVHSEEEMSTTAHVEELELIDEVQHSLSEFEELKQRNVIENGVDFNDFVNVDANLAITAEVMNDATDDFLSVTYIGKLEKLLNCNYSVPYTKKFLRSFNFTNFAFLQNLYTQIIIYMVHTNS